MDNIINPDDIQGTPILAIPQGIPPNIFQQIHYQVLIPSSETLDVLEQSFQEQKPKLTPANKEFVNNLPRHEIQSDDLSENCSCSICMDSFREKETCIELPCGHKFHLNETKEDDSEDVLCDGLLPWLQKHNTCPVCRYKLPEQELTEEEEKELQSEEESEDSDQLPVNGPPIDLQSIFHNIGLFPSSFVVDEGGFSENDINEAIRRSLDN